MTWTQRVCWLLVAGLGACGGSSARPDGGGDPVDAAIDGLPDGPVDAAIDAPPGPPLRVQVSKSGSDLHDGVNMPVETLKRALQIAAANPRVTAIAINPGTYSMRSGETFPYQVPTNLVISGTSTTVLLGSGLETGLTFGNAQLQDITLDSFKLAIDATAELRLKNVKIFGSATAIHGARTAKLRIDDLQINGACSTGIKLEGELFATTLNTIGVAPVIDANAPGPIDIATAGLTLEPRSGCTQPPVNVLGLAGMLALKDVTIAGGNAAVTGIRVIGTSATSAQVTLTGTIVRSVVTGMAFTGVTLRMSGGSLSGNDLLGLEAHDGSFSLDAVNIAGNNIGDPNGGGLLVDGVAPRPTSLVMRRCVVVGNNFAGIAVGDHASADLGTAADPGNNRLEENFGSTVDLRGGAGQSQVNAGGNTWQPDNQGSDSSGHYPSQLIVGPVTPTGRANFALAAGWRLQL